MDTFLAWSLFIVVGVCLAYFISREQKAETVFAEERRRVELDRESDKALKQLEAIVNEHVATLCQRRTTLIHKDRYGVVDYSDWQKELWHFINNVVARKVDISSLRHNGDSEFEELIEVMIDNYEVNRDISDDLPEDMTPLEFEGHCCDIMRDEGWDAHVTKGSGDQGADVVANKNGKKVVIQCKFYAGVVGNQAVQEVMAAKTFYGADHAVVVCTTSYSRAAQQLAQSSDVALLMYHELRDHVETL